MVHVGDTGGAGCGEGWEERVRYSKKGSYLSMNTIKVKNFLLKS
jgi:hypothetical protein